MDCEILIAHCNKVKQNIDFNIDILSIIGIRSIIKHSAYKGTMVALIHQIRLYKFFCPNNIDTDVKKLLVDKDEVIQKIKENNELYLVIFYVLNLAALVAPEIKTSVEEIFNI